MRKLIPCFSSSRSWCSQRRPHRPRLHDRPHQIDPVDGQVGTEFTYFIDVNGCASSNKQPTFKVVDGRLPTGTKLFDFACAPA